MKECSRCGELKHPLEFFRDRSTKDGRVSACKTCYKIYSRSDGRKLAQKKYRQSEHGQACMKKYHQSEKYKQYANSKERKEYNRKLKRTEKYRRYEREFKRTDLASILRARFTTAIKKHYKSGSAVRDLGCSIEELRAYLESQFQPGMTWENRGRVSIQNPNVWNIDHKIPLDSFDLTDRKQLLQACHYTNLQPLWAMDNIYKGNK